MHTDRIYKCVLLLLTMNINERNRNNVISRWEKIHSLERKNINFDSKYLSRLCGFLAGDGCLTGSRKSIRFFPDDESLIEPYIEAMKIIYNKEPKTKIKLNHFELSITSKVIFEDLSRISTFGMKKWGVPFNLFNSESDMIEWLRAFFDAEAHVNVHSKHIKVSSVNEKGLNEVNILLDKLGIHTKIYKYQPKNKKWSTNYLLVIHRKKDLEKYGEIIGFNHKIKLSKLYKLI